MELRDKPRCEFGAKCYRKNPKHLESYSHPPKVADSFKGSVIASTNKTAQDVNHKKNFQEFNNLSEEQTVGEYSKKFCVTSVTKPLTAASTRKNYFIRYDKKQLGASSYRSKKVFGKGESSTSISFNKKKRETIGSEETCSKKAKTISCFKTIGGSDDFAGELSNTFLETCIKVKKPLILFKDYIKSLERNSDCESVYNTSQVFTKNNSNEAKSSSDVTDLKNKKVEEEIKALFLVKMPPDFYSFFEFCEFVKKTLHLEPLKFGELKLVGPFDIFSGKVDYSADPNSYLCHWRFYYDPPEFQTVLAAESGFHIGYWRDEPKENPVFLASNNSNKDCIFKIEAENLFGAVFHYLEEFKSCGDPFKKVKTDKLQLALKNWAKKNDFTLERKTNKISQRQKKIVSKTFHGVGIVVPVEAKTELGYRPLIETDAGLKNICELIMKANDENERESLWENLHPLITAANIANDECDFGNSLELGIDLFCMGSPVFHETVEHLLTTAYSLLNRTEFEKIIRAHLKFRRKDNLDLLP